MNRIEKLLPTAIDTVQTKDILVNGKVPKEFNGYISSFGSSMIASGILPTLVFFSQENKSKGSRTTVVKALEHIIKKENTYNLGQDSLLNAVMNAVKSDNLSALNRIENALNEAAIALKLAIRIFPKAS